MYKFISNLAAIISAVVFAFCWHVTILLASLGLGSAAMGNWIKGHKPFFLAVAVSMMSLSLFAAIQEKRKKGKNTGLIVFAVALLITTGLLIYNKVRYGALL